MDMELNCSSNSELLFFILVFLLLFYDDKCIETFRKGRKRGDGSLLFFILIFLLLFY
jgi:hypothetical protein